MDGERAKQQIKMWNINSKQELLDPTFGSASFKFLKANKTTCWKMAKSSS